MSPVTHFLTGWVLAAGTVRDRRARTAVTLSAIAPDVDGLGAIPEFLTRHSAHPISWFTDYHHLLHNLVFGLVIAIICWTVCARRWTVALLSLFAFHLHLLEDLVGARGPDGFDWPMPYLLPFSHASWSWAGQWPLNSWQNLAFTMMLLPATLWIAVYRGCSPVQLVSPRMDAKVVATLRLHAGFEAEKR